MYLKYIKNTIHLVAHAIDEHGQLPLLARVLKGDGFTRTQLRRVMRGLILSAGLGERLRPLTMTRAKPSLEFLNVPMLAFPYFWLNTLGLTDLTLNTHHLPDSIRAAALHVADPAIHLHFTHEPAILGSGGGIWNARFHLQGDDTFAVANGDAVVLFPNAETLRDMLAFHRERRALATLLTCPLPGVGEKIPGVWMSEDGLVAGFGKKKHLARGQVLPYASFMLLSNDIWREFPEGNSNILYDVLSPRLERGERVFGYKRPDLRWFETAIRTTTSPPARRASESGATVRRWAGRVERIVTEFGGPFHDRSNLDELRLIADSAEVSASASFRGFAVVGPEVNVGEQARVERGVLLPSAKLAAGATLRNAVTF